MDVCEYTGSSGSLLKCVITGGSSLSDDKDDDEDGDGEENVNLHLKIKDIWHQQLQAHNLSSQREREREREREERIFKEKEAVMHSQMCIEWLHLPLRFSFSDSVVISCLPLILT